MDSPLFQGSFAKLKMRLQQYANLHVSYQQRPRALDPVREEEAKKTCKIGQFTMICCIFRTNFNAMKLNLVIS